MLAHIALSRQAMNTSCIEKGILDIPAPGSSNPVVYFFDDVASPVQDRINDSINYLAEGVSLHDSYSIHLLYFCKGYYNPTDVPNETVLKSTIRRNVTNCIDSTVMFLQIQSTRDASAKAKWNRRSPD